MTLDKNHYFSELFLYAQLEGGNIENVITTLNCTFYTNLTEKITFNEENKHCMKTKLKKATNIKERKYLSTHCL